jgi:hypothetical protein
MPTNSHTTLRAARRRTIVLIALFSLAGAACTAAVAAGTQRGENAQSLSGSYNWPVKPFDQPHPVRGVFGDPRTSFDGPPTSAGLNGRGSFSYHAGVDISAPDGTAVYPVRSGIAHLRSRETVVVTSESGDAFEYWHIVPSVREGQRVTAFETVLGRIRPGGYEHVHLTELRDGKPVNPLGPGHLTPYADHTRPQVDGAVYLDRNGRELLPEFLRNRVQLVVSASDDTAMSVPGRWNGLPVVPARISWRIERAKDGTVVVPETEAFDVRARLPRAAFWATYARGSRQNMANFAGHKMWRQPGVYLVRLTASFDTTDLKDDIYELVATATDSRGNAGVGRFVFTVHNKPGFFRR